MSEVSVTEFDVIFVSYDEDNADENWADLQNIWPHAKRVHGVYGSDAAHKAAAEMSDTDRFTTCDADTVIKPEFFDTRIPKEIAEDMTKVISWSSKNVVNGLVYGNGSLKCWTKPFVMGMKTHEESDQPKNKVEFCFESGYTQSNDILSITHPNGSPRQAWRSGFREGVKMSLNEGIKAPLKDFKSQIFWKNMTRLLVWCSVGADIEHGMWCMYGARMGCFMTMLKDWDYIKVRDFEYLNDLWTEEVSPMFESYVSPHMCTTSGYCWDNDRLISEVNYVGRRLREDLGLDIAELDENASNFFRAVFKNPARVERKSF